MPKDFIGGWRVREVPRSDVSRMGLSKGLPGPVCMPSCLERRFRWQNISWKRPLEEVSQRSGICQEWENGRQSVFVVV